MGVFGGQAKADRGRGRLHGRALVWTLTMPKRSAGLLMYRRRTGVEVLLAHPGGPFWAKKDLGVWTIPKGEYLDDESPLTAAIREFEEEMGASPRGHFQSLGDIMQSGRKLVTAFALEGNFDIAALRSNTFELEWPPRSGRKALFPEVDRVAWFPLDEAHDRILPAQREFLTRLVSLIESNAG
jgi:predicted NUDIX family NTP pyrophosphohydrolase